MYPGGVRAPSFCYGSAPRLTRSGACAELVALPPPPMSAKHLPAAANRDPSTLPAQPLPSRAWTTRPPRLNTIRARQMGFASFGTVMKDAHGPSHKSCYL